MFVPDTIVNILVDGRLNEIKRVLHARKANPLERDALALASSDEKSTSREFIYCGFLFVFILRARMDA